MIPEAKSPRVVVVLYGLLRQYRVSAPSLIKHVIKPQNADLLYFGPHYTDQPDMREGDSVDKMGGIYHNPKQTTRVTGRNDQAELREVYGDYLKKIFFHDHDEAHFTSMLPRLTDPSEWLFRINPARILSMFYNIEGAMNALASYEEEKGEKYDVVYLTRPDLTFYSRMRANPKGGELHIPFGAGIFPNGVKGRGNAPVLFYKNVTTGEYAPGAGTATFNDQFHAFAGTDRSRYSGLLNNTIERLGYGAPPSPETLLYLHLIGGGGLKVVTHDEWVYAIERSGAKLIESVADSDDILRFDRSHRNSRLLMEKHPLKTGLADTRSLAGKVWRRLTR